MSYSNMPLQQPRPRWGAVAITEQTYRCVDLSCWLQPGELVQGAPTVSCYPADLNITFGVPTFVTGSAFSIVAILVPFTVGTINDTDYIITLTWQTNFRPLTPRDVMLYVGR